MDYFELMQKACKSENLNYNEDIHNMFLGYMKILKEWNEKINLTAIKEDEEIIKKHFIDSLKILKIDEIRNAESIIDIGTGAGLPGIPLKIMLPEAKITLLDSLNKRVNFLMEVINKLNLKKIEAIHGRAEEMAKNKKFREKYDVVVSRAVASLPVLSEFCIPYVKIGGIFVAMKGPSVDEEIKESEYAIKILGGEIEKVDNVNIEDSDLNHKLVIIRKIKNTNKEYPRKYSLITKKPLCMKNNDK